MNHHRRGLLCCVAMLVASTTMSHAQVVSGEHDFDIPPQELKYSLRDLAKQAGLELAANSGDLNGKRAPLIHGHYSPEQALKILLAGSGLSARISEGAIFIRGRADSEAMTSPDVQDNGPDVVVTGSRIRNAPPTSPVVTITAEDIKAAGQSSLGEAARSLTQNFAGGQNPGVAYGTVGAANQNINSASSINLRGLGPDATLTLLNGHRLAYGSFVQAIDINAIPLAAVDRLEIVADGASAIYGSDAVGGVANIVLKRDYQGIAATARYGAATEGGDQQQQYSIVGGTKWSSGAILAAYNHEHDTALRARQREYLAYMPGDNTVIPGQDQNNAIISGHQSIAPGLEFSADAIFSNRDSAAVLIVPGALRYDVTPNDKSWAISPSLEYKFARSLSLTLSGVYGQDRTNTTQKTTLPSGATSFLYNCYCSNIRSIEATASGTALKLPTGNVRIAVGAGYRSNGYYNANSSSVAVIDVTRHSYYGFGEAYLPLASPSGSRKWLHELSVNAAIRYEDYPGIARVATPKFGVIYAPSGDFDFKGSWGRSFKAPTQAQQYQANFVYLYKASALGGTSYPANATALYLTGGNADLKPEKAETWTASLSIHPRSLRNASLDISYFHLKYRDRVTQPIQGTNFSSSLSDARYANFVLASPSAAIQAATIAQAINGLNNLSGATYLPGNVVALVRNAYLNAATQHYQGIDVSGRYKLELPNTDAINLSASASWLKSEEQLDAAVPERELAGTIFNSPHYRARGGAVWDHGRLEVGAFGNYTGGVTDTRNAPYVPVGSQSTADFSLRYAFPRAGHRPGFDVGLAIQNAFNDRPAYAKAAANYYVDFDSTNQSAIGRFVSLTIGAQW